MTKSQIPILAFLLVYLLSSLVFGFSFAVIGDKQYGDEIHIKLLKKIVADPDISFIVNTGDFALTGQPNEYRKYIKETSFVKIPTYHVIGNHDAVYGGVKTFNKYFGPTYYSFNYGNSHFAVLDNALKNSFNRKQFDWFVNDLKNNKKSHTFVFLHKPVFDASDTYPDHIMGSRYWIEKMIETFQRYKVDYVFAGHIHGYGRAERDGIVYIICAGGGATLYMPKNFGGFFHYVKITVDGDKVYDKVVKLDD